MSSLTTENDYLRAHNCALKILNSIDPLTPGDKTPAIFENLSNKELDDTVLYFTELLHRVSEEVSHRKHAPVSIHVDYIPEEN
ncbi:MAG: hypothetical protein NE327_18510 [Lentisphaeraceae bacterium]|nr:hypothetical protein [Lentisphaeraceae bacterium]